MTTNPTDPAAVAVRRPSDAEMLLAKWGYYRSDGPIPFYAVEAVITSYGDQREADARADERAGLDAWLVARIEGMDEIMKGHIMAGSSLDGPSYRLQLGQHIAYMAMRSFISGCKREHMKGSGGE